MKTFEHILDEVAAKYGFSEWDMIIVEYESNLSAPSQLEMMKESRSVIRRIEVERRGGCYSFRDKLSGWISVKDQTPPDYQRVLWVDSRDGMINLGYFVWRQTPVDYCTHWMPLPEPPK